MGEANQGRGKLVVYSFETNKGGESSVPMVVTPRCTLFWLMDVGEEEELASWGG